MDHVDDHIFFLQLNCSVNVTTITTVVTTETGSECMLQPSYMLVMIQPRKNESLCLGRF